MSSKVDELLHDIKINLSQHSASQKDETRVMVEMLNDPTYKVGEYDKSGKVGEYCPYEDARKLVSSVLSTGAKIPVAEAKKIASEYEFSKAEANSMINISKEFVNTYIKTGRKLPLGGREKMGVSLSLKEVPTQQKKLPANGIAGAKGDTTIIIPEHETIKVSGGCPVWQRTGK
jgi:hypothetical protein